MSVAVITENKMFTGNLKKYLFVDDEKIEPRYFTFVLYMKAGDFEERLKTINKLLHILYYCNCRNTQLEIRANFDNVIIRNTILQNKNNIRWPYELR